MKTDRRKEFTDERKEFLEWLCNEDINTGSAIEGILTVEEHDFLRTVTGTPYYYLDERAKIKEIIEKNRDKIMPAWNEYYKTKG